MRVMLLALFVLIMLLYGCTSTNNEITSINTTESSLEPDGGLPLSWIMYEGNKYVFHSHYDANQFSREHLRPTGDVTNEDDGAPQGIEIWIDEHTGDLYIFVEIELTNEKAKQAFKRLGEWVRYSKVDR